jgi:hypothetical protein
LRVLLGNAGEGDVLEIMPDEGGSGTEVVRLDGVHVDADVDSVRGSVGMLLPSTPPPGCVAQERLLAHLAALHLVHNLVAKVAAQDSQAPFQLGHQSDAAGGFCHNVGGGCHNVGGGYLNRSPSGGCCRGKCLVPDRGGPSQGGSARELHRHSAPQRSAGDADVASVGQRGAGWGVG